MKKSLPAVVGFLGIIGVVFAVAGGAALAHAAEPHPHIYNAYRLLRRATSLARADSDLSQHVERS
jgi:hypothetical protein